MTKKALRILNAIILGVLLFLVAKKVPDFLNQRSLEGTPAPPFVLSLLSGETFDLQKHQRPLVVVFWATWCTPCQVELARMNQMVA